MSRRATSISKNQIFAKTGQELPFFPASTQSHISTNEETLEKEARKTAENFGNKNPSNTRQKIVEEGNLAIQNKNSNQGGDSTKSNLATGNGDVLPNPLRKEYEQEFGADFSQVKIHSDSRSADLSQNLQAKAFTLGHDIYFNSGRSNFQTTENKKLLAHELTHVLQGTNQIQRDPDQDAKKAEEEKIEKLKTSLVATFSLKSVEDGSSSWTSEELRITKEAMDMLPKDDIAALKDVVLKRVTSLGGETAGQFGINQSVDDTTITNEYELSLADLNFKNGSTEAEQKRLVQHEVGHAIASLPSRKATLEANQATAKFNEKTNEQNEKVDEFNTSNDEANVAIEAFNEKVTEFNAEKDPELRKQLKTELDDLGKIVAEKRKERGKKEAIFNKAESATNKAKEDSEKKEKAAAKLNISQKDLDAIDKSASTAKNSHDKELTDAKGKITDEMTKIEEAQKYEESIKSVSEEIEKFYSETKSRDKSEDEVETLIKEVDKKISERSQASEGLSKKDASHPLLTVLSTMEKEQDQFFYAAKAHALAQERSARVQKFVDFVEKNSIPPISDYASKNWPHKPEEFYAEAYSFWVSKKLSTISPDLQKWFDGKKYK